MISPTREDILRHHYTHSLPSGKTREYVFEDAIVLFSIPANPYLAKFVLGREGKVWELTRLWAPDGHAPDLLTRAIAKAVRGFRKDEPTVEALVSFADPNAGHKGGVYRAASWIYTGQSEEARGYRDQDGRIVARRKFHAGSTHLNKAAIEALGFKEVKVPGKFRFVKGLTDRARRDIARRWQHIGG